MTLRISLIQQLPPDLDIFVERGGGQGVVVGYYNGSMVYVELYCRQNVTLIYGERLVEVTRETFQILAIHLHEKVGDRDYVDENVWIVPASFCAFHYINNGRDLLGHEPLELERLWHVPKNIVEFYQIRSPHGPTDFQSH